MTMIPVQHRVKSRSAFLFQALHQFECDLRVSMVAYVVAAPDGSFFNKDNMTVSVQPVVQEVIRVNAVPTQTPLPVLDDVPVEFPNAGGWSITFPIQEGDECRLTFSDMAFDLWWQNGGLQNQPDGKLYRHDIGDATAFFGLRNKKNVIPDISPTSMQLRNDAGDVVIDLADGQISLTAGSVKVGSSPLALLNHNTLSWLLDDIVPFLQTKGYGGPAAPTSGETTVLGAT